MKTWLTLALCLLASFLASDRSFVSGYDLEHLEAEEEMSLRAFSDDEAEEYDYDDEYAEEDEEGDERKRRGYGGGNSNFGQPTNLRPVLAGPGSHNGGVSGPGFPPVQPNPPFPQPLPGNSNPVFPQPLPGNPNVGFPQPLPGHPNPGFPQPLPGNRNPVFHQPLPGNANLGRPIIGKICRGVPRSSPHWVPGLDTWCPQNCPRGNCPSYLCICY